MNKAWQVVAMLFTIAALNYADRSATTSVFPLLRRDLGLNDLEIAATGSLFLWAYAIGSPLAGRLADRVSRSRIVVGSLIAWSVVTLASGFAITTTQLLISRILLGAAECMYLPAAVALIADHHSARTRASAMGVHLAGLNFGLVGGGALAGYMGEHYGWRAGFFVLGGAGLALAAAAAFILSDSGKYGPAEGTVPVNTLTALKGLIKVPSYWVVVVQAMVIAIGIWMFINWLPLYFRETYGMSLTGAGFFGTFMLQGAGTLGILVGGYISDKFAAARRERRMLLQASCYFVATPFLLAFLTKPDYAFISFAIFAFSFFRAVGAANEHPVVCDLLPPNMRSTAVGLMNTTNCLAGGAGIMVAGQLKQALGLGGVFSCISALVLFAAALVFVGYRYFLPRDLARRAAATPQEEQPWQPVQALPVTPRTAT